VTGRRADPLIVRPCAELNLKPAPQVRKPHSGGVEAIV